MQIFEVSGKVVIVTGGTRGIGRGIAETFLAAGSDVLVCSRNKPDDVELPRAVGANGVFRSASFIGGDVRDPEQAAVVIAAATERHGKLDVLINNAGGSPEAEAATASPRFSVSIVALNLLAPLHCAQSANAVMQQQGDGGCIVNIASISGVRPSPGTAAYGAAKAGLIHLTTSLAQEWAPNVRVNCVIAGLITTEAANDHYGGPEGVVRVANTIPLGRMGSPADIAMACLYLASPAAKFVTGSKLEIHGGGERPPFLSAAGRP